MIRPTPPDYPTFKRKPSVLEMVARQLAPQELSIFQEGLYDYEKRHSLDYVLNTTQKRQLIFPILNNVIRPKTATAPSSVSSLFATDLLSRRSRRHAPLARAAPSNAANGSDSNPDFKLFDLRSFTVLLHSTFLCENNGLYPIEIG